MNIWLNFAINAMAFGTTFVYGSTGEILTEKSGHLNLGIPGIMCMGGAGGCLVMKWAIENDYSHFQIVALAILGAFLFAFLCGLIYSFVTVTLRANQNVTGLALNIFGTGLAKVIIKNAKVDDFLVKVEQYFRYPFADHTDSLHYMGVLFFMAIIIALLSGWVLFRTKRGLYLRAVGENPATADAMGINVTRYKYLATCIGSGIAGLGGFYYISTYMLTADAFLDIEAMGWLSIALVIFVLWRPHMTIVGSTVFGALFIMGKGGLSLIKGGKAVTTAMQMLPYIVTIIVLIISSIRNKRENQPPASLGLSYFREER